MKKYNWQDETDEYIKDEITMAFVLMKDIRNNEELSEKSKQILIDDCLDKLNTLYDEQRKRGTFKRSS
jgi:hypothetical protein